MPRLIFKAGIFKTGNQHSGNYLHYIATREGVAKIGDGWRDRKMTSAQQTLIDEMVKAQPKVKALPEYNEWQTFRTRGYASEFIARAFEEAPEMLDSKSYLDYIATRPRAERFGSHGLFSDDGKELILDRERRDIQNYSKHIFTGIISLKREDAERLSFNSAESWRSLLRGMKLEFAKCYGIPVDKLKWYGAYHNEQSHPHVHLVVYSADETHPGYLSKDALRQMKSVLETEIFKDDLSNVYQEQTKYRDQLTSEAHDELEALVMQLQTGLQTNPELLKRLTDLAEKLRNVSGKKVYGYLPPALKADVDAFVDELEKDERIKKLYDLWHECRQQILRGYSDQIVAKKPLSQEPVFKPIRNAVIKSACELGAKLQIQNSIENAANNEKSDGDRIYDSETINEAEPTSQKQSSGQTGTAHVPNQNTQVAGSKTAIKITTLTRLMKDIGNTFRDRYIQLENNPALGVDSRLRR
ncbi:MAG TPA: MobP3 family relaxase, partial [Bacillota bacterium]|nr:MobP3 family relaxase [Bacillota bacterium]